MLRWTLSLPFSASASKTLGNFLWQRIISLRLRLLRILTGALTAYYGGLGNPQPPLSLDDVRELLKLDRAFYTADDPSLIREAVSRIRVATIQVASRPMLLVDAIRKWSLQALYLPDGGRILLDASLPQKKHRWNEAHEISHSLLPWHDDVMHGDNRHTLSPACAEQIEGEANFGAGRLLFLRDLFATQARDHEPTIASVQRLHKQFGNTIASTLWRFVETVGTDRPLVGMLTCHPHRSRRPPDFDPAEPCRHCIQSPAFAARFSRLSETDLFRAVASYCGAQTGGPLGEAHLILTDDNGEQHLFAFETFFTRHKPPSPGEALTLGISSSPYTGAVAV